MGRAQLADGRWRAFLYADGVMVDLDDADSVDSRRRSEGPEYIGGNGLEGATLNFATGINESGAIVANGCLPGPPYPPRCLAFKLTPLDDPGSPANVPALSALALCLLALLLASTAIVQIRR